MNITRTTLFGCIVAAATLAHAEEPRFRVIVRRNATNVTFSTKKNVTTVKVTCPAGIDRSTIERLDTMGASVTGTVELVNPMDGVRRPMASIELMFSHVDHNRSGLAFPQRNFVFTDLFMDLLRQSGFAPPESVGTD